MRHILLTILSLCAVTAFAQTPARGVQAYRQPIQRVQPNGDTITVLLRGDEWHHFTMTADGWEIQENKRGYLCYSRMRHQQTQPSCRKAHNANRRSRCEQRWLNRHGIRRMEPQPTQNDKK